MGVVCDWDSGQGHRGGWRTVWTASRSSGRRIAFFSIYINTVVNAKFGEGAFTLSSTFKLGCLVAKHSPFTDVRFVSCIHFSIDVKIEEPYRRRSRADAM